MSLVLKPVRVATGADEEGMLVYDQAQRLVAVLTHLSNETRSRPIIGIWRQDLAV